MSTHDTRDFAQPSMLSAAESPDDRKLFRSYGLWIGGAWRPGKAGGRIDVVDPSSGNVVTSVADGTVEDGLEAVAAAYDAAPSWAATPPRTRAEILHKAYSLMVGHAAELAHLISLENGKSLSDSLGEVAYAAEFFRWFGEEAVRLNGELALAPNAAHRILVQYQPIGVSLLVTPWNFPAAMATRKIGPALAAGCTVVLKPASETPLTAFAIGRLLEEAGLPPGVVNIVSTTSASEVVRELLHDPRVRKLSFTGSTQVGRTLLREAADRVISCSMELGGNAPFIVFEDADLRKTVDAAMVAKMRNGGEACTAANRFFVHREVVDHFATALANRMASLKVGPGYVDSTQCGPLINRAAVDRIDKWVNEAITGGARLVLGGTLPLGDGFYYPPTVLVDVPASSKLMREEVFGPVVSIATFDNVDEVVRAANDTEYGLVSYVFTEDLAKGLRVAERLETGMVGLNRGLVSEPAAPFGGVKQSGLGREGAHHGILEFCQAKYISTAW